MSRLMIVSVAIAGGMTDPAVSAALPQKVMAALSESGSQYVSDGCHVGLSVAMRMGEQTVVRSFGTTTRDRVRPPTPDSVYELASGTKTFTGALAAKALVEGRMALDSDFREYLSESYPNLAAGNQPITLRSLATHTSGLQRDLPDSDELMKRHDYDNIGRELAALDKGYDRARSLAALHHVALRSVPGATFAYSNIGIRLIGYGLEHVYGSSLERLLHSAITDRLKMTDTALALTKSMRARLTTPYSRFGLLQPYHDASAGAAYGLYSTPRDMARYLAWQLDPRDPVVARSHTPIRGDQVDGEGLIWNIGRDGDELVMWHGGGSFGETSQIVLYPRRRLGLVLLANDACEGSEAALKKIAFVIAAEAAGRGTQKPR